MLVRNEESYKQTPEAWKISKPFKFELWKQLPTRTKNV